MEQQPVRQIAGTALEPEVPLGAAKGALEGGAGGNADAHAVSVVSVAAPLAEQVALGGEAGGENHRVVPLELLLHTGEQRGGKLRLLAARIGGVGQVVFDVLQTLPDGPFFLHEVVALFNVGQAQRVVGDDLEKGVHAAIMIHDIGQGGSGQ